jgi:DNA uptake protein ComE-like DNA-binding protein
MPTKHPRINAVVEEPIYEAIEKLAEKDGVSLSQKTRELLLDSLERIEDVKLAEVVESRQEEAEFISHEDLKDRLGLN